MKSFVFRWMAVVWVFLLGAPVSFATGVPPELPSRSDFCPGLPREMGVNHLAWGELQHLLIRPGDPNVSQVVDALDDTASEERWWQIQWLRKLGADKFPGILRSAMSAAGHGQVKLHQVATLDLYWNALEAFPVETVRFFPILDEQGHITSEAREFFFGRWTQLVPLWGERQPVPVEKVSQFEQAVAQWPRSEQFVAMIIFKNEAIRNPRFSPAHQAYLEEIADLARTFVEEADDYHGTRPIEPMQIALHPRYGDQNHTAVSFTSFSAYNGILKFYSPQGAIPFQLHPLLGIPRRHHLLEYLVKRMYVIPLAFPEVSSLIEPNGRFRGGFGSFILTFELTVDAARDDIPKYIFNLLPRLYALVDRYAIAMSAVPKTPVLDKHGKTLGWGMDSLVAVDHPQLDSIQVSLTDLNFNTRPSQEPQGITPWLKRILLVSDVYVENKVEVVRLPGFEQGTPLTMTGPTMLAWVVVDMAKHPEIYEEAGVPIAEVIQDLGSEARALYRAVVYNDSRFFGEDQVSRSIKLYRTAWDIYRRLD